jgi:ATPase subunit of ABC transporter with duplicated ATPase domains
MVLVIWLLNCEYDLVILDEPTFGLGRKQVINLARYLELYLKTKHLIIISHDIEFIQSFCDQTLDLDQTPLLIELSEKIPNGKN